MELSSAIFRDILSPLAAFKNIHGPCPRGGVGEHDVPRITTEPSAEAEVTLKPPRQLAHTTIDNTSQLHRYTWTIQGADPDGRRLFALPRFAFEEPPLRIDVYLPPLEDYHPDVRAALAPDELIYTPRDQIRKLKIVKWVEAVLEEWSVGYDTGGNDGKFEKEYKSLPFGSRILISVGRISEAGAGGNLESEIYLVPDYDVEQGMMSVEMLRKLWEDQVEASTWPEIIDLEELCLTKQLHEAISIVTLSDHPTREWVFKSLTRDQRYLYNELRMLLTLGPHDNIISRPRYIVTKKGRFGGRRGVCGFVLEYFPTGSLRQFLLDHSTNKTSCSRGITLQQKLYWAKQITKALIHINSHVDFGFYTDLKPDNIVLRPAVVAPATTASNPDDSQAQVGEVALFDALLVDLEQRGGWFSWSPPEVAYLEYIEILASADLDSLDEEMGSALEEIQDEITGLLKEYYRPYYPGSGSSQRARYYDSPGGFSAPWLALLHKRRVGIAVGGPEVDADGTRAHQALHLEKAQVFMLGKLLWCIFEEEPSMRCGIDHELLRDRMAVMCGNREGDGAKGKGFPEFEKTPERFRGLIRRCTAGAGEWEDDKGHDVEQGRTRGWRVILDGMGRLVPGGGGDGGGGSVSANQDGVQRVATTFWREEVGKARRFVWEVLDRRETAVKACEKTCDSCDGHAHDDASVRKSTRGEKMASYSSGRCGHVSMLEKACSRPTLVDILDALEEKWCNVISNSQ